MSITRRSSGDDAAPGTSDPVSTAQSGFFDQPLNNKPGSRIHQVERGSNVEHRAAPQMDEPAGKTGRHVCPAETASSATPPPAVSRPMRDRLVRLAYRFLWNPQDAEDVVQDALTAAHQQAGDLRNADRWWSWVCRIVVHRCHEHGRQMLRRKRHEQPLRIEAERRHAEQVADDVADRMELLRKLLPELPRRQHEVIVLRHLQGMSYVEIADILSITTTTARVHARAGREGLRRLMLGRHPDWFEGRSRPSKGRS